MTRYIARRLLTFVPILLTTALLVFLMIDFIPGDPVAMLMGLEASGEAINAKRIELGLHRPLQERLASWFLNALKGDLGDSFFLHQSVSEAIANRIPVTYSLAFFSLAVAVVVGMAAGVFAGAWQGRAADWGVMLLAMLGVSIPSFWLAMNMILLFVVKLRWLPLGGFVPFSESPAEFFRHLALPGLSLGLIYSAMIARMTRASMLEVLRMDFIRTARAKGLGERAVILSHALKNALIPVITMMGIAAGGLLGGSVVIETVFNMQGIGRLVVEGIRRRDYPVIQGGILVVTLTYLVINLIVDITYVWVNPRIRYE
jgi:peptide/nickel transport system permease protein